MSELERDGAVLRGRLLLRKMDAADLERVMEVERRAFKSPWSTELFQQELKHAWSTVLLAEEIGAGQAPIVGFLIYWLVVDEVHVINVAVDPERRREGVARTLLAECIERSRARGARLATLEVRRSNQAAIRLYENFAFRSVSIRVGYYSDENEDAIVMLREL